MIKCFVIDSAKEEIREEEVAEGGTLEFIQEIVDGPFDCVSLDEKNDLYINDEFLFRGDFKTAFSMEQGTFLGNGVVVGLGNVGEAVDTNYTLEQLRALVIFHQIVEEDSPANP